MTKRIRARPVIPVMSFRPIDDQANLDRGTELTFIVIIISNKVIYFSREYTLEISVVLNRRAIYIVSKEEGFLCECGRKGLFCVVSFIS